MSERAAVPPGAVPLSGANGAVDLGAVDLGALWAERLRAFRASHSARSLTIAGQEWPYLLGGDGERTAVLLHGSDSDGESLFSLMAPLERSYRVLAPTFPAGVTTITTLADGLAALMETLDLGAALVAGYSLGGYVAQALAWRHPGRVGSLALLNTGAPARAAVASEALQMALLAMTPTGVVRAGAGIGAAWALRRESPGLDRSAEMFWRGYLSDMARRVGKARMWEHGQLVIDFLSGRAPEAQDASGHAQPATLIVDSERDRTIESAERRALHARYPRAARVTQPNAGHLSALTQPEPYLDAIAAAFSKPLAGI